MVKGEEDEGLDRVVEDLLDALRRGELGRDHLGEHVERRRPRDEKLGPFASLARRAGCGRRLCRLRGLRRGAPPCAAAGWLQRPHRPVRGGRRIELVPMQLEKAVALVSGLGQFGLKVVHGAFGYGELEHGRLSALVGPRLHLDGRGARRHARRAGEVDYSVGARTDCDLSPGLMEPARRAGGGRPGCAWRPKRRHACGRAELRRRATRQEPAQPLCTLDSEKRNHGLRHENV